MSRAGTAWPRLTSAYAPEQHESRACCCAALMTGGGDPRTGVATDPRPMKAPLDT